MKDWLTCHGHQADGGQDHHCQDARDEQQERCELGRFAAERCDMRVQRELQRPRHQHERQPRELERHRIDANGGRAIDSADQQVFNGSAGRGDQAHAEEVPAEDHVFPCVTEIEHHPRPVGGQRQREREPHRVEHELLPDQSPHAQARDRTGQRGPDACANRRDLRRRDGSEPCLFLESCARHDGPGLQRYNRGQRHQYRRKRRFVEEYTHQRSDENHSHRDDAAKPHR